MPFPHLLLLLTCVTVAAAVTVWGLTLGGPGILIAALPAFMIATAALWWLRR